MKVEITKSTNKGKKLKAVFTDTKGNKVKTIHFGQEGASDFTIHKDINRKKLYLDRHRKREKWSNPQTAGSLARWILWNKKSLQASIADYKKIFKLS